MKATAATNARVLGVAWLLAVLGVPELAAQGTGVIQGRVVEAGTRLPLANVQVYIPETELGTLTDGRGAFVLPRVPSGEVTVRVELIGYTASAQTVLVSSERPATVSFELRPTAIALDEVVVTGTPAAVQRREIGNAIATVSASQIVELAPVGNVTQLLTGRSSGLVVSSQSGMIGAGAPIRLRGDNSLSLSGDRIVYMDGVRVDAEPNDGAILGSLTRSSRLHDFAPYEIESIEILKPILNTPGLFPRNQVLWHNDLRGPAPVSGPGRSATDRDSGSRFLQVYP